MKFRPHAIEHLDIIVDKLSRDGTGNLIHKAWRGKNYRSWAKTLTGEIYTRLPDERHTRHQLRELVQDARLTGHEIYLAVMAWGGQHMRHAKTSWAGIHRLEPILRELRLGKICRLEGYRQFREVTWDDDDPVKGLGPAFYTKLLFFVPAASPGYIMDQWTAKSMQLLVEDGGRGPSIRMSQGYVAASNGESTYELFCQFIEKLAERYGISADNAEELVFSGSGERWRSHVVSNWSRGA
jgi:hypothetical protein